MSTEKYMVIRCNSCGMSGEAVDQTEMKESEYRSDLKKRFGWLCYRVQPEFGSSVKACWKDVCPNCQSGGR